MAEVFANRRPAPIQTVEIGDLISVSIWDVGSGLFSATQGSGVLGAPVIAGAGFMTVPNQVVDQEGAITVPFAGRIPVLHKTPYEVQLAVQLAFRGKASNAQALVTVAQSVGAAVTVTGDINHPGRLPLTVGGTRLLDLIAEAGGPTAPATDTAVELIRNGVMRRVRLISVIRDPRENIFLQPNDLIFLDRAPQSVVVLGAANHNAQISFGKADLTLAEALGNGGGLTDIQADPYGVFVFRYEPAEVVRQLAPEQVSDVKPVLGLVPVIYQVDFKNAKGFFMAERFMMRDRDLVYVSNAESVQLSKLAHIFSTISSIFNRSAVTTN